MRKIFLHAGKHKTGTSSIQFYIQQHADFFAAQGVMPVSDLWFAPEPERKRNQYNCTHLAHIIIRPEFRSPIRVRGVLPIWSRWQQVDMAMEANRILRQRPDARMVISAESFSFLRTEEEKLCLEIMMDGFELVPIVFFREPSAWLQSWETQITGLQKHNPGGDLHGTVFDTSPQSWLVEDHRIRAFYGDQGQYIQYEDALKGFGSSIPAFLEAIGIDPLRAPDWRDTWRNLTSDKLERGSSFA